MLEPVLVIILRLSFFFFAFLARWNSYNHAYTAIIRSTWGALLVTPPLFALDVESDLEMKQTKEVFLASKSDNRVSNWNKIKMLWIGSEKVLLIIPISNRLLQPDTCVVLLVALYYSWHWVRMWFLLKKIYIQSPRCYN